MFKLKGAINASIWKFSRNVLNADGPYQSAAPVATSYLHTTRTIFNTTQCLTKQSKLCTSYTQNKASTSIASNGANQKRNYASSIESSNSNGKKSTDVQPVVKPEPNTPKPFASPTLPALMKFPLKHWLLGHPVILRHAILKKIDPTFSRSEFKRGAKEALITILKLLTARDYAQLEHMITPNALDKLKTSVDHMTYEQRQQIGTNCDDRVDVFLYQYRYLVIEDMDFLELTVIGRIIRKQLEMDSDVRTPIATW